jgi:hypothetical protein
LLEFFSPLSTSDAVKRIRLLKSVLGFPVRTTDGNFTVILRVLRLNVVPHPGSSEVQHDDEFTLVAKPEASDDQITISQEGWKTRDAAEVGLRVGFQVLDPTDGKISRGRAIIQAMLDQGVAEEVAA